MFRKAILALALLASSAKAQVVAKKVASFQVCGQYFTAGNSAADTAQFLALGNAYAPTPATNTWNTWKSGAAVATGPLFAGACPTTAQTGNGIGRVLDICDPNVWQPITVNYPCTLTTAGTAGAGANAPTSGTCPGATATTYAVPDSTAVRTFCQAQTVPFPTATTATTGFCRGEIDIIGAGKYAGHVLKYDYQLAPTYTALQGAHSTASGLNNGVTVNSYVTCVYYPAFAATTGRAIAADGKYFKNGWIKKLIASVTIAPARLSGGPSGTVTTDFVTNTVATATGNVVSTAKVPADTTGLLWAETITVTYVKPYYNLQFL